MMTRLLGNGMGSTRPVNMTLVAQLGLLLLLLLLLVPRASLAYAFLCNSWQVSADSTGFCPGGARGGFYGCTCDVNHPLATPHWSQERVSFTVEQQAVVGLTAGTVVERVRRAGAAWNNVSCSSLEVVVEDNTLPAERGAAWGEGRADPGVRAIYMVADEDEWRSITGNPVGGTLGVTASPYAVYACDEVWFTDTDILINGFLPSGWTADALQATVLHEMGHSLGLGHPCLGGPSLCVNTTCESAMAASTTGVDYVTPQQDDIDGLCALYPAQAGGFGSRCEPDATESPCATGFCYDHDEAGTAYCSLACDPQADPDDGGGSVVEDEEGISVAANGSCPDGYRCRPHGALGADDGGHVCVRRTLPEVGEACSSLCVGEALCVAEGAGWQPYCRAPCDAAAAAAGLAGDCGEGEVCARVTNGAGGVGDGTSGASNATGVCLPEDRFRLEGQGCDGVTGLCTDGLTCVAEPEALVKLGGPAARCHRVCDPFAVAEAADSQQAVCVVGDVCVELGEGGSAGACWTPGLLGADCVVTEGVCEAGTTCIYSDTGSHCRADCSWNRGVSPAGSCPAGFACGGVQAADGTISGACLPTGGGADADGTAAQGCGGCHHTDGPAEMTLFAAAVWFLWLLVRRQRVSLVRGPFSWKPRASRMSHRPDAD